MRALGSLKYSGRVRARCVGARAGDAAAHSALLARTEALQEAAQATNAYGVEGDCEKVAVSMGFGDDDLDARVGSWLRRAEIEDRF